MICIIPVHEESQTIGQIVRDARKFCDMVLVVDDGSEDNTAEIAAGAGAKIIRHAVNLGVGAALSTGFIATLSTDAEIIVTMDGDGQHDPDDIPHLLQPIRFGDADVVIGSRLLNEPKAMPRHKRVGNRLVTAITSWRTKLKLTDSQSGFRAYRKKILPEILPSVADYSWASEMLHLIARGKFKVKEVAIKALYIKGRAKGVSFFDCICILLRSLRVKKLKM